MTIGIYAIRNKVDGKMYIGKSSNVEKRIKDHIRLLKATERNKKQTNGFYGML
jgi:predicted GIY-YIG superfamily endonuclease